MKIISSIQRHAYILVGIIALCIITFLYETINPNLNLLRNGSNYIGKVNGESLDYDAYRAEFEQKEKDLKQQKNSQNLTEQETSDLKNQIWGQFLLKNIVLKNLDKLGLGVSPKEIVEITKGQNIDPSLRQIPAFQNQMGQYDPMQFDNFLKTIKQDDPGTLPGTRERQWLSFEKQLLENRKISKLNTILENGLFVPKWLSDYESKFFGTNADVNYVMVPYSTVDKDKIKYEKSEVEAFFNQNKNRYIPTTPTVKLATVSFPLMPSTNDSIQIFNKFATKIAEMTAATNDTTFFRAFGDKSYDPYYYKADEIPMHPKSSELFSAPVKSIIGPYIDKDNVKAIKILARKNITDSVFVKAITISFQDVANSQDGQLKRLKLVDSIFKMVDTLGMNFDEVATKYSADRGQTTPIWISKAENMWDPEIFIHGGVRKHFKSPSQREGVIRILKVLNYPAKIPAVQYGEISMPYTPSTETQQATLNTAMNFIKKCKTAKDIETVAKANPGVRFIPAYVTQDNNTIQGVDGNAREAIKWGFDSKSGEISNMLQVGNNYVYLGNLGKRSKDDINFADAESDVLPDFKTEKVFQLIGDKMSGNSLNEIATKNATTVMNITGLSFSNSMINQMPEPAIVAVAGNLTPNKISKPIKGTLGVYKIVTTKLNPSSATPAEELNAKTQLNQQFKSMQGVLEGMLNRYNIDDNRINMF